MLLIIYQSLKVNKNGFLRKGNIQNRGKEWITYYIYWEVS